MDRRTATKTLSEREDEEVERLVRPSPKVKPPRHDLRRETVEGEEDPDLEKKDKDLSKNFKDIGGSVASRVVARWAKSSPPPLPKKKSLVAPGKRPPLPKPAGAPPKLPAPPKPAGVGAKPPPTKAQRVKVRSKETGWVGWISKDKLKEAPASYELAQEGDEEKFGPGAKQKTQEPAPPNADPRKPEGVAQPEAKPAAEAQKAETRPETKPTKEAPSPSSDTDTDTDTDEIDRGAQKQLRGMGKEDPSFKAFLKALKNPKSEVAQLAKGNPALSVKPFMQGKEPPEGVKTIGDLARVVNLAPAPKPVAPAAPGPASAAPAPAVAPPASPAQQPASTVQPQSAPPNPAPQQAAPQSASPGGQPAGPGPQQPPAALKYKGPKPETATARASRNELQALIIKNPALGAALKDFANSKSQASKDAVANPWFSARQYLKDVLNGDKLPADIDCIADLQLIMALPPEKAPPKEKSKGKEKGWKTPEAEEAPKYAAGQPERAVTSSEREESIRQVSRAFPPKVAAQIMMANPPYHPDEIGELIRDYNVAKALPSSDLGKLLTKAKGFYATDPGKVAPPADAKLAGLAEPERAKAIRKHQVQTVAMSLGVKAAVSKSFEERGAPPDLSNTISDFMLLGAQQAPAERSKRAEQAAEKIFVSGLARDPSAKPLSDVAVKDLLRASGDPAVQKLIVGYCQAKDYQEARGLFLDPKSSGAISERQSHKAIASKLGKAAKFLRQRAERYPEGSQPQDTYAVFRNRVMKHLAALQPKKAAQVQDLLDVDDNGHYDKQLEKHKKAEEKYQKKRAEVEQHYDHDYKAYSEKLRNGGDPNEDTPPSVDDRMVEAAVERPRPPAKPLNYDKLTKKPKDLNSEALDLWKKFQDNSAHDPGLIPRVASRGSICSATCAMDRTAVYWGVEPYPKGKEGPESYHGWEQPQARDLGDADFSNILKAARSWLKQPVLATDIEGIVRDTQLRAALDLALRAENYDHAVHPAVYNKLLARLAGVSENETLLTVRSKTARNPMSKKVELETARADRLLAGLDRIASVVQANHKQWGMDFTAAKNLVNAVDKIADELEMSTYGERSLLNRQTQEIGQAKLAQVLERDPDEKYLDTFKNPMSPHQTEADEPYMKAYRDDQSSAVRNSKTTTGRPLVK